MSATATEVRLTGLDRCDACDVSKDAPEGRRQGLARAFVRVEFIHPEKGLVALDFCSFHYDKLSAPVGSPPKESPLTSTAHRIVDQRIPDA